MGKAVRNSSKTVYCVPHGLRNQRSGRSAVEVFDHWVHIREVDGFLICFLNILQKKSVSRENWHSHNLFPCRFLNRIIRYELDRFNSQQLHPCNRYDLVLII